ncbi:hypothetical protein HF086_012254 [Spodoptera exigua]|uniref:Uncharacterized protein n=1 Tax=Spodoptera exigua TaxID=7107 RepID=A0A922SFC3_SPOEX|nr:hypothetical protein HF086_012254 [Spodoptera exigua]
MRSRIGTQTNEPTETVEELPVQQPTSAQSIESGSIWDEFDAEIAVLVPQNSTAAGIVEFDKYIGEPLLKRTENPLLWWNERKAVYPGL